MGKINILDKHVAELISAGEVVERPSSVIKELIENCIDASATSVTIEIRNGGKTFMRVTDNGTGISRDDVSKAFLRNATSKIKQQTDLDYISTLGFRGEALASICAVSKVELMTCVKGENIGTRYEIHGGEEVSFEDYGCADGTTIIVRDLFYNVPGRMKFLKKDVSEGNAIAGAIDRVAMSSPCISFNFIRDGKKVLTTPGDGDLYSCIYSIYGKQFAETLIPLDYNLNGIKVSGFISMPLKAKATRSMQHFFINGRYVKTRTAMAALEEAFKRSIMVGKFPACVMFIEVPFDTVDVNVHPAKIEVRFMNERQVFDAVYYGVKTAISKGDKVMSMSFKSASDENEQVTSIAPQKTYEKFEPFKDTIVADEKSKSLFDINQQPISQSKTSFDYIDEDDAPEVFIPVRSNIQIPPSIKEEKNEKLKEEKSDIKEESTEEIEKPITEEVKVIASTFDSASIINPTTPIDEVPIKEKSKDFYVVGEAFKTYIIIEQDKDNLIVIDKHAAHERMIYEKLKSQQRKAYAQFLIKPEIVTLSKEDYDVILLNAELLEKTGFEVEDFGTSMVQVRTVPIYLSVQDIEPSILEMASYLRHHKKDITTAKVDWIYHNIACRAAVKAGESLRQEEMIEIYLRLTQNEDIKYCPHGRPISIVIKKKDLEKQFKRIM